MCPKVARVTKRNLNGTQIANIDKSVLKWSVLKWSATLPGTAEELTFWCWKSRIRDSPWRQPSSALKISGMLGGGARINLIFVRSCRTRFARVRGEKRFLKHKPEHKLIPTAFTRPAGLDLVYHNPRCGGLAKISNFLWIEAGNDFQRKPNSCNSNYFVFSTAMVFSSLI